MTKNTRKAIYKQILNRLETGYHLLDDDAQNEIKTFLRSKQSSSGLYVDRANNPDLYYSLFGCMLSIATCENEGLVLLKKHLQLEQGSQHSLIDKSVVMLMKIMLGDDVKISPLKLLFTVFRKHAINMYYRVFITVLLLDASGTFGRGMKLVLKILLKFAREKKDLPCSICSAMLVAKHYVGSESSKDQERVLSFYDLSGGFKAVANAPVNDMLSTAVALFALALVNYNLTLIKPDCMEFIESHYELGAFISVFGDDTCDLEYTFYGLLALGSLTY